MTNPAYTFFDADTGRIDSRTLDTIADAEIVKAVDEARAVKEMTESKGWKLVEQILYQSIDNLKDKLVDSNDLDELKRCQAIIRAYSNVLGLVATTIANGESLEQYRSPSPTEG